jgi:hypothetical protein
VELIFRPTVHGPEGAKAALIVDRQEFPGFADGTGAWHFVFSPKDAKTWSYRISSNHPGLDGQTGALTSRMPELSRANQPSALHPNWWTDDPTPAAAEAGQPGVKHVNRWRAEFLRDFAARMQRCVAPRGAGS